MFLVYNRNLLEYDVYNTDSQILFLENSFFTVIVIVVSFLLLLLLILLLLVMMAMLQLFE